MFQIRVTKAPDDSVCDIALSDHDSSVTEGYSMGDVESDKENCDTKGLLPNYNCYVKVECLNYKKWIEQNGKQQDQNENNLKQQDTQQKCKWKTAVCDRKKKTLSLLCLVCHKGFSFKH